MQKNQPSQPPRKARRLLHQNHHPLKPLLLPLPLPLLAPLLEVPLLLRLELLLEALLLARHLEEDPL